MQRILILQVFCIYILVCTESRSTAVSPGDSATSDSFIIASSTNPQIGSSPAPTASSLNPTRESVQSRPDILTSPTNAALTRGWFGDVGFYALTPKWGNGNPAYATVAFENGPGPIIVSQPQQVDFNHNAQFAPLLQLGYVGQGGLGVRARWWTLSSTDTLGYQASSDKAMLFPDMLGTGQLLNYLSLSNPQFSSEDQTFTHQLSMNVLDAEGVWNNSLERTSLFWSAGIRYAYIGQSYWLAGPMIDSTKLFGQGFTGAGPTASLQVNRRIGQTSLAVFGLGRGSLLYGTSTQRSGLGDEPGTSPFDRSIVSQVFRPVGELELGTAWNRCRGRYQLFAESAFVGMVWFNAGNAANSGAIQTPNPLLFLLNPSADPGQLSLADSGSNNANQDLGLVGLRFSTGIRF